MDTQSVYFARDYRVRGGYYERFQLQLSLLALLIFLLTFRICGHALMHEKKRTTTTVTIIVRLKVYIEYIWLKLNE